ncbi:TIGR00269 family protein [Nanoarchaeota archaeon]
MPEEEIPDSRFKPYFEKKIRRTIRKYKLCTRKDKIVVAVSGGKDSTVCLYVLNKMGYDVEGITIDANIGNYTKKNLENLKEVCKKYKIKLNVISFREEFGRSLCYMRCVLKEKGFDYSSCMLCGILKRYLLNKYSKKLGFDVLATGHNLDDEAQAFLMNLFRNDTKLALRQGPISGISTSTKFVKRIKPLYWLSEKEVKRYSKKMKFPVNYGICPCSVDAYRRKHINILNDYEKKHPSVKYNLLNFHEGLIAPLKENLKDKQIINSCEVCGEPCSKTICRTCEIFSSLEKGKNNTKKRPKA